MYSTNAVQVFSLSACIALTVFGLGGSPVVHAAQTSAQSAVCSQVKSLRASYGSLNRQLAAQTMVENPDKIEDWDSEEDSCISDYGVSVGLSLSSVTSGLLDGLKDAACDAMDSYIGDQLAGLTESVSAPLGLAGVGVEFGEIDACEDDESPEDDECESPFSVDQSESETAIDVDWDSVVEDAETSVTESGTSGIFNSENQNLQQVNDGYIDSESDDEGGWGFLNDDSSSNEYPSPEGGNR